MAVRIDMRSLDEYRSDQWVFQKTLGNESGR